MLKVKDKLSALAVISSLEFVGAHRTPSTQPLAPIQLVRTPTPMLIPLILSPFACRNVQKEKDALAKKQKLVEQGLGAVNAEMAEFQKEKQGRLNQLDVVVGLRLHQVRGCGDVRSWKCPCKDGALSPKIA